MSMNFKKVLLLVAITALLTSCGCSNSARRSSKSDPVPISEVPVSSSQQPESHDNPPIEISSNISESHDNPPVSSEQHGSSNGGGQQSSSTAPSSSSQTPSSSIPTETFTVTWQNYDGSILEIDYNVPYGTMPSYDYETPRKPSSAGMYYTFSGWSPTVVPATADATYTAQYTSSSSPAHIYSITWKNYDGTVLDVRTCGEGSIPTYVGDTPRRPSSNGKYYTFSGWDPTPVPAYSDAIYTATFSESTTPPVMAEWPTAAVNEVLTYWGAPENSFPPFADERITSFDTELNGLGDTLKIACNGMSLNEGRTAFPSYASSYLSGFTLDETISPGKPCYIDPSNHFYISYDANYPSIFRLMAVKYSSPVSTTYTVIWQNYDGTVLETDSDVAYGTTPKYNGPTPTRPNSTDYRYYYTGWDKELSPVMGNVTYTATYYESIFEMYFWDPESCWLCNGLINKNYAGEVVVPSAFYDGRTVGLLSGGAFLNCVNVTKLTIPTSVYSFGEQVFSGMTSLQELTVPFVGKRIDSTGADAVLGYFFGENNVSGTTATQQYYSGSGSITRYIPDSLHKVIINGGVISRGAFDSCANISTVILNEGVTEIKTQGFYNSSITAMVIPSSVTSIDDEAFARCQNLVSFYASNDIANEHVLELGWRIFAGCKSLTTLSIPMYGVLGTLFGSGEFDGCSPINQGGNTYYIPNGLASVTATGGSICARAFEATTIPTIVITDEVITIAEEALAGDNGLVNLTIPFVGIDKNATEPCFDALFGAIFSKTTYGNGITYGAHQQYDSSHYTYNYIPHSLKNVTVTGGDLLDYAFSDVNKIETVTLDGAKSVGSKAFYHCSADISLNEGLETIADHAFNYSDMDTDLVIPDSVTSIGEFAFSSANSITSIVVGANVETIGKSAFNHCDSATSITFKGNKVKTIQSSTFNYCGSLTKIVIPEGVTKIGGQAFDNCGVLADVTLPSTLTDLKAASIFSHNEVLTTIKFNGTVAQWKAVQKASNWISSTCPNVTTIVCSDGNSTPNAQ